MSAAPLAVEGNELVDTALVQLAQSGDEEAIADLLRRARPLIQRMAGRFCSGAEVADDIVQNCLLIVFTDLHRLRAPEAFIGWVQGIVRNVCCKEVHRSDTAHAVATRLAQQSLTESTSDVWCDPEEVVLQHEARVHLMRLLEQLEPRYRNVVALRTHGYTYEEIARRLDISSALARLWFFRCRRRLRGLCTADDVLAQPWPRAAARAA